VKLSSLPLRLFAPALLFVGISSCSENLDNSGACAVLCPPVGGEVQTIILDAAVTLDTTVQALSGFGAEPSLFLASRGDTLDTRVIIRFDSIPATFAPAGDTVQPIMSVDSAYIRLEIDTLSIKGDGPFTIEAYDVDTTANDTSTAAILALFRPDRFITSQVVARSALKDTLLYYIPNATVLDRIQNGTHLRVGLRVSAPTSSQIRIGSAEGGVTPLLLFRATPDTTTQPLTVFPLSTTPVDEPIVASHLSDYTIVAIGPPPAPASVLAVGGLRPHRVYIRFDIPSSIIDSTTVIRATLLLNQLSNPLLDPTDAVLILPQLVFAGKVVTDPAKATQIASDISGDTLLVFPGGSGEKNVELARAFTVWHTESPDSLPRAIVLKTLNEGNSPLEIRFSSSEDVAALRPRLRISYTSRVPLRVP
jgi:hypothetical protein